jgi:F0F1-type ATP synthase assembly protein I
MQLIGVAVGLGCGYLLDVYTNIDQPWVYFGPVMFFVGLVMILYYFRSRKPV